MGASIPSLISTLSRKFLLLVLLSSLIGAPIAHYLMQDWLQDFAYQIQISNFVYIGTGLVTILIAFAAIIFHSMRISTANPVKALRYD